jgi:hypothetical protein
MCFLATFRERCNTLQWSHSRRKMVGIDSHGETVREEIDREAHA